MTFESNNNIEKQKKSKIETEKISKRKREEKKLRKKDKKEPLKKNDTNNNNQIDNDDTSNVEKTIPEIKKQKVTKPVTLSGIEWRKEHSITVFDPSNNNYNIPEPMLSFNTTPFSKEILNSFEKAGYTSPTHTQAQSWPIALAKRDLISIAKTGSGKTVGFLLPSFHHISNNTTNDKKQMYGCRPPRILVLAPTRELATQIDEEAKKFSKFCNLRSTCIYGGAPKSIQIRALEAGVDCLIATPGRLNDLLEMRKVQLSQIEILVLDEADRMLDMGFEPQIRTIISEIPKKENRQTLLFSATWPKVIQKLANEFLNHPIQVNMGEINVLQANKDIIQKIEIIKENEKEDKLLELINNKIIGTDQTDLTKHPKSIVFFRTKRSCDRLANQYWDNGYAVDSLHGDKEQYQRTRTMNDFKNGTIRLLFATDVAARGLDVKDVEIVVNYDLPNGVNGIEDYVHRIGRTGRAGAKGLAYTFFTEGDKTCARKLVEVLRSANQVIPDELLSMCRGGRFDNNGRSNGYRGRGRGRGRGGGAGNRQFRSDGRGSNGFNNRNRW